MDIFIYDKSLTLLGVIDDPISLIWTRRYWECGEFKLLIGYSDFNKSMLAIGNIITIQGYDEAGQISYIAITADEQGEQIEVKGRFLLRCIGKRIIETQILMQDTTEKILYKIVNDNAVNPANTKRKIPKLTLGTLQGYGSIIDYASDAYVNALTALSAAAKAGKLGIKIITNFVNKNHIFTVYKGKDLTEGNNEGNLHCVFTPEYDNILSQNYSHSVDGYKNTAYVGGEIKEGADRVIVSTADTAEGLERTEVFINAADIKQSYLDKGEEITMPLEDYKSLLVARGNENLSEYDETATFDSDIYLGGSLEYKKDYDIGDRVTCKNKKWGITRNVRVTEVQEIYQDGKKSINIKFGESTPKLLTKFRQILNQKGG